MCGDIKKKHRRRLHSAESLSTNETRLTSEKTCHHSLHFQELKPTLAKDTLGLGANVVGNCKQKLLSVHHLEEHLEI